MTAIIVFCLFLASFFSRATIAALVGIMVCFAGYFVTLATDFQKGSLGIIILVSLHPISAILYGLQEIGRLEDAGVGVNRNTFSSSDIPSGFCFLNALRSLGFDCLLWGFFVWYLNRVICAEYDQPLPFYFPIARWYWCPGSQSNALRVEYKDIKYKEGIPVEPVTDVIRSQMLRGEGIAIHNLQKTFGDKVAVDGLSLGMYKGEVTALLGRNGAG